MGTSVSSRLSPPCRFLPARPQINASRTQCALRRILLTSFASTASSLSCPRNPLAATENPDGRSAPDRTDSREDKKSLISMSALPELHEGLNPALPPPALELAGGQMYQMQVRSLTIHPRPSTKRLRPQPRPQGMLHHFHQPTPLLPTHLFRIPTRQLPCSYPPYPALRTNPWLPAAFPIPSYASRCDTARRLITTLMKT